MLLATLLLAARGLGPDFDQPISLDLRGVGGKELGIQLTNKTGIRFETVDEATFDHYVVHFDKTPLRIVMAKIADAENGEWMPYDQAFRLRRSPTRVAKLLEAHRADQIKRFEKTFADYRKQLAKTTDFSDDAAKDIAHRWRQLGPYPQNGQIQNGYWEKLNELQREIPIGRAFMRVLLTFSAAELADLPVRYKVAYSTNPTPVQRALSPEAYSGLEAMINEEIVWEDAAAKYLPEGQNQMYYGIGTQGKIRSITNAMVVFTRWDYSGGVNAQLILSDGKRRVITETYLSVDAPYEPMAQEKAPKPPPRLPVSDDDREIANLFRWDQNQLKQKAVSDRLRSVLMDPEKNDPLAGLAADCVISLANYKKENVAAVLDDRCLSMFANSIDKKGLDPQLLDTMPNWQMMSVSEGDGCLVLSEQMPALSDQVNADRHTLHTMLMAAEEKGRLNLDDAAAYALTSERFNENPIPGAYLAGVLELQGHSTLDNDPDLLRFYGSLDPAQRKEAEHLPMASLSTDQLAILEKMVYGMKSNLQEESPEPMQPDADGQYYGFWNTIDRESSVSLGSGIPSGAYIVMTSNTDKAIMAEMQYGEWYQGEQTYDSKSLAWMMAARDTQQDNLWTVLSMRAADRTMINFDFKYTEKLGENMSLQDILPVSKKSGAITQLPDDMRAQLMKDLDEAKKSYAQGGGVYYGGFNNGRSNAPPK